MPEIAVRHVVSASSADPTHCAENLLRPDTYRKWKAAQPGEKQISGILQFEKEEQIHGIDIGNEGSAFVEVLAGSSASPSEQDYEVLLVTSSFMSPSESRSGSNLHRVRLFGPDKLVRAAAERRWDRVKIICSQPYSKTLAYGLSFVRFHSPPDKDSQSKVASPKLTKFGQFKVKDEDGISGSLRPGALFFSRASKAPPPDSAPQAEAPGPSYAAATLQASAAAAASPEKPSTKASPKDPAPAKRRFELGKEKAAPSAAQKPEPKAPKKPRAVSLGAVAPPTPSPRKPQKEGTGPGQGVGPEAFERLLQDVVLVLSGFQNPFRAELRDQALAMGARYRPDWTPDSTHLICAFANTPKYSQVKRLGGIILRKEWVLDCHRTRRRLPVKRYLMDGAASSSSEEGSENEASPGQLPSASAPQGAEDLRLQRPDAPGDKAEPSTSQTCPERDGRLGLSDGSEDESGDTDDELRRVEEEHRKKQQEGRDPGANPNDDPYGGSTDENTEDEGQSPSAQPIPELPDFFVGKGFFLYGEFPAHERRLLTRYITAFNGELEDYMNDRVNYVVTAQDWDQAFEEALHAHAGLAFVRPRWIFTCGRRRRLVPYQPFTVGPCA
ncbi:DNA repair protein XRCC1 isoform X2 [Alligator sinensis]|nr:DNA repair protein XRCC1 isoform X2 [Alligator sinensis]